MAAITLWTDQSFCIDCTVLSVISQKDTGLERNTGHISYNVRHRKDFGV